MANRSGDPEEADTLSFEAALEVDRLTLPEAAGLPWYPRRVLRFDRLQSLDEEVAAVLVRHRGKLGLDGLKAISPELAAVLARHKGPALHLNGLREVTVEVATALAGHQRGLFLNGLESLSQEAAEALAAHRGTMLIAGLETDRPVAQARRGHQRVVSLPRLSRLSVRAAEALAGLPAEICLPALSEVEDAAAEALIRHAGRVVIPGAFLGPTVSLPVASLLSQGTSGRALSLPNLAQARDDIIGALARHQGTLRLEALTALSDVGAAELAAHEGDLWLDALVELSDAAAASLAALPEAFGLWMPAFVEHHASHDEMTAAKLRLLLRINHRGQGDPLRLGVRSISVAFAEALVSRARPLQLDAVTRISDDEARVLARNENSLSLGGLLSLTESVAASLGSHKGRPSTGWPHRDTMRLSLDGVTSLPSAVAERLLKGKVPEGYWGPDVLSLKGLVDVDDGVLGALSAFGNRVRLSSDLAAAVADWGARR